METSRTPLRGLLELTASDLHAALMRSWDIAEAQWLPALSAALDSFNSYPHLRNVEHYLDVLVTEPGGTSDDDKVRLRAALSPAEIYVLLTATLLHDIGRTKGEPHGLYSGRLLESDYAELGIPSKELAKSIARVAAYHDGLEIKYVDDDIEPYSAPKPRHVVDPYGPIRETALAALLRLADYLDSTLTRVMPEYVSPMNEIEIVGAFRRVVTGVEVDHKARMICTVFGDVPKEVPDGADAFLFQEHEDSPLQNWLDEDEELTLEAVREAIDRIEENDEGQTGGLLSLIAHSDVNGARWTEPSPRRPSQIEATTDQESFPAYVPLVAEVIGKLHHKNKEEACTTFESIDWLLARRVAKIKSRTNRRDGDAAAETEGTVGQAKWHPRHILAIVLSDVLKNARGLFSIRSNLAALGIPIHAWLLGSQERLFNLWGEETFEPIFTRPYLKRVIDEMWSLSVRVFGQSLFTYPTLADALRDPDVERVRRAVHRISVIARNCRQNDDQGAVWAGDNRWQWNCGKTGDPQVSSVCADDLAERTRTAIDDLGDPL